jgi:hypothetical protein
MRTSKLAVVAALVASFCLAATASASASTTTCNVENASIKLSPGLTETPAVQNIQIKGDLSGCTGESMVTGGKFQLHEKTAAAVTCKALTEGAAAGGEEAKLIAKWAPMQEGGNSQGPASVNLIEGAGTLTGTISSGAFEGHAVSGSLTEAYTGGPECGKGTVHKGKEKKAKKVSKGTASGTLSVS